LSTLLELTQGAAHVRLAPALGGRVTRLRLAGGSAGPVDILHPFPEVETDLLRWPKGGLYPLVPYWGRIREGRLATAGGVVRLRPHPDAMPHTLHGPAHRHPWRTDWAREAAAQLHYKHPGDEDWPWRFRATLTVALPTPERCELALAVENAGEGAMPAGLGFHPYFAAAETTRVVLDAGRDWPMDDAHLSLPAPGDLMVWDGAVNGPVTCQIVDWNGRARLCRPEADILLEAGPDLGCLVLHRPAAAAFLCLEPVSHVADAFNLAAAGVAGSGARSLMPGERLMTSLAIVVARRA
jgi:aldose 1-epimerase